jgi:hypothetical protein
MLTILLFKLVVQEAAEEELMQMPKVVKEELLQHKVFVLIKIMLLEHSQFLLAIMGEMV